MLQAMPGAYFTPDVEQHMLHNYLKHFRELGVQEAMASIPHVSLPDCDCTAERLVGFPWQSDAAAAASTQCKLTARPASCYLFSSLLCAPLGMCVHPWS